MRWVGKAIMLPNFTRSLAFLSQKQFVKEQVFISVAKCSRLLSSSVKCLFTCLTHFVFNFIEPFLSLFIAVNKYGSTFVSQVLLRKISTYMQSEKGHYLHARAGSTLKVICYLRLYLEQPESKI